jgi:predicted SprT family Zn-dependent metalloprotease
MNKITSTQEFYGALETAYKCFNENLFDGELPECIFVISRKKYVMGHMDFERWTNTSKNDFRSELAINSSYIASSPIIELFQTIVHEQCHLWQHKFGNPSIKTYHNKEWSEKMKSIGLMPSHTGRPGGRCTGQKMSDYPIEGGLFSEICEELVNDFQLDWIDKIQYTALPVNKPQIKKPDEVLTMPFSEIYKVPLVFEEAKKKSNTSKTKYTCNCNQNIWGKLGLDITCNKCGGSFVPQLKKN